MSRSFSRHGREAQPLLHHGGRDEEAGGNLLLADALVTQRLEGTELIERMQGDALDVLGERILFRRNLDAGSRTTQGTSAVLARRFCLTRSSSAR